MLHETLQNWYRTAETKGEARGIVTGEAKMLLHLLADKFCPVEKQSQAIIYRLDEKSLFECVKRLPGIQSVQEVINPHS